MSCEKLKAGDRVWMMSPFGRGKSEIKTVHKTTRTQVVIDVNGDGSYLRRYNMEGYLLGKHLWSEHIGPLATPQECASWDAQQERKRIQANIAYESRQATERQRVHLCGLFSADNNAEVSTESYGSERERADRWTVSFHFLSTEQVKQLATILPADLLTKEKTA